MIRSIYNLIFFWFFILFSIQYGYGEVAINFVDDSCLSLDNSSIVSCISPAAPLTKTIYACKVNQAQSDDGTTKIMVDDGVNQNLNNIYYNWYYNEGDTQPFTRSWYQNFIYYKVASSVVLYVSKVDKTQLSDICESPKSLVNIVFSNGPVAPTLSSNDLSICAGTYGIVNINNYDSSQTYRLFNRSYGTSESNRSVIMVPSSQSNINGTSMEYSVFTYDHNGCRSLDANLSTMTYLIPPGPNYGYLSDFYNTEYTAKSIKPNGPPSGYYGGKYRVYDENNNLLIEKPITEDYFPFDASFRGKKIFLVSYVSSIGCESVNRVTVTYHGINWPKIGTNNNICQQTGLVYFNAVVGGDVSVRMSNWKIKLPDNTYISVLPYTGNETPDKYGNIYYTLYNGMSLNAYLNVSVTAVAEYNCELTDGISGGYYYGQTSFLTLNVLRGPVSEPVISPMSPICQGESVTLNFIPNNYTTFYNVYESATASTPIVKIYSNNNLYTYTTPNLNESKTYYVSNYNNPCGESNRVPFTVNVIAKPIISFAGLKDLYCQNGSGSVLTGIPAGGTFTGDIPIGSNIFIPSKIGLNTITYSYTASGCMSSIVQTTRVLDPRVSSIPSITLISSNVNPNCGGNITYTATLTNIPANRIIQWKRNGVLIAGATALTYSSTDISNGERILCMATFLDPCTNTSVTYASDVYMQSVTSANNYLKFDGIDDKLTIPSIPQYDLGSGDFTMGAYVSLNSSSPVLTPIISKRNSASSGFVFYLNGNQLMLKINGTSYYSTAFSSIKDQYLHAVAVTRQSGTITFYLDGNPIGTAQSTLSINSTADVLIGSDWPDNTFMNGYVNNVCISAFANDFIVAGPDIATRTSEGIIGCWRMNDCAGQTANDESIYGNSGLLGSGLSVENSDPVFSNAQIIAFNPIITNAVSFASTSNSSMHIEIPNRSVYDFNNNFTIEAFISGANSNVNSYPTIISKRSSASNGFGIGVNNGKVFVTIGGTIYHDNVGGYNLNNSACNHIVVTHNLLLYSHRYAVYVNGTQTLTFSNNTSLNTTDPIWIGNDRAIPNVFNATIDEIRIWNITKTQTQIASQKNSVFNATTPNLIAYYRFKENINDQLCKDESSTNNAAYLGSSSGIDSNDPLRLIISCNSNSRIAENLFDEEGANSSAEVTASVYPNPFETTVKLKIVNLNDNVTIHVFDSEGRLVYVKENHSATEELILGNDFPVGMYVIQFMNQPDLKPIKFIKMR